MADEKILPFENKIVLSGRELELKSAWEYIALEIQSDRSSVISLITNFLETGLLIFEWADGSDFDFGVDQGGTNLLFAKNYGSDFDGLVYLLSKTNFADLESLSFSNGFTQIDYNQINTFPLTNLTVNPKAAINGNIGDLPPTIKSFNDQGISEIKNYVGSNFSDGMTLFIVKPIFSYFLFTSQVDQLIIDLSLINWGPGGVLDLSGYNQPRSAASDAAVIVLQNQGVTVTANSVNTNNDYYMYNNQFDNLNSANEILLNPANTNFIDFTTTSGQPIQLNGLWFVQWVCNNVVTQPVIFGGNNTDYEIKLTGGGNVSINTQNGAYAPVVSAYVTQVNKVYTLQSDGSRFILFENGSQVDIINIGANDPVYFEAFFMGFSNPLGPASTTFAFAAFGVNGVLQHEYLLLEATGVNVYDSVGGFHAEIQGAPAWTNGVNTPIQAGTQMALNSWNNNGGVFIPEDKNNLGFDVLGAAITRFKIEDGYNFPGLQNVSFNATNFLDRTGPGTDIFIFKFFGFTFGSAPFMFVAGDDVFIASIVSPASGVYFLSFEYGGGTVQGVYQLIPGVNYMVTFLTDGTGFANSTIAEKDLEPQPDADGNIGSSGPPTTESMAYSSINPTLPALNFDGYIEKGVHFPRALDRQEMLNAWYYYRRFL